MLMVTSLEEDYKEVMLIVMKLLSMKDVISLVPKKSPLMVMLNVLDLKLNPYVFHNTKTLKSTKLVNSKMSLKL